MTRCPICNRAMHPSQPGGRPMTNLTNEGGDNATLAHTVEEALAKFELISGAGNGETTACAMTLLSWIKGEAWTDNMPCAHPILRSNVISANDAANTTPKQRAALVEAGLTGVIDTWWIPSEVIVWALGQIPMTDDEPAPIYARTLKAVEMLTAWKIDKRRPNLVGANLRGVNLRGANLRGANLRGANLVGADLWGADLGGANLREANLVGANLRRANLRGVNLRGADLVGANLGGVNLVGADLVGANLGGATYSSLTVFTPGFDPKDRGMVEAVR